MSAKVIAVYSLKGGVGKTTLAVNLAWAATVLGGRKTLLWDLDAQAAASFILGKDEPGKARIGARAALLKKVDPRQLVRKTATKGLDLLPADASLRSLDIDFRELDKKNRLANLTDELSKGYDLLVIDCPPGLTETSDQILRAADLVVVPVIPSPLARRAYETVEQHVSGPKSPDAVLLPVFSMVDRRRILHRAALAAEPDWPVVPMASAFEAMTERRAPMAAKSGAAALAVAALWQAVEVRLTPGK